jgi:hypothetical protein
VNDSDLTVSEADTITREFRNLMGQSTDEYDSEQDAKETEEILLNFKNLVGEENIDNLYLSELQGNNSFNADKPEGEFNFLKLTLKLPLFR